MILGNQYSRILAPVMGAIVGGILAFKTVDPQAQQLTEIVVLVLGGAALGAMAGGVVWLMDVPDLQLSAEEQEPISSVGSLFALLAVVPGFCPFVGLLFAIPAFILNRKVRGWQGTLSRLGLGVGILLTVLTLAISLFDLK